MNRFVMDALNSRKDALPLRDTDRFTELLLDPLLSTTEAEAIFSVEKAASEASKSGILIRGSKAAPVAC